jgi:hypothetical protein
MRQCPIKRFRRTKAEVDEVKSTIVAVLKADHPMTVRQVFYQLVVRNVIEKTEEAIPGNRHPTADRDADGGHSPI